MEQLYRWVKGEKNSLPKIDLSDFPEQYAVRVNGDDPRSGWIYIGYETAEKMREIREDYWEWLEPIEESEQDELWTRVFQVTETEILKGKPRRELIDFLSSKYLLIKR